MTAVLDAISGCMSPIIPAIIGANTSYSSTVIPAILTAWVMSYIEKLVDKITPSFTKNFLKPALILLISSPVAFLLRGPLGSFIGNGLSAVLVFVQSHASVAAYVIMAAAMPFIVMTGMHWASEYAANSRRIRHLPRSPSAWESTSFPFRRRSC